MWLREHWRWYCAPQSPPLPRSGRGRRGDQKLSLAPQLLLAHLRWFQSGAGPRGAARGLPPRDQGPRVRAAAPRSGRRRFIRVRRLRRDAPRDRDARALRGRRRRRRASPRAVVRGVDGLGRLGRLRPRRHARAPAAERTQRGGRRTQHWLLASLLRSCGRRVCRQSSGRTREVHGDVAQHLLRSHELGLPGHSCLRGEWWRDSRSFIEPDRRGF